MRHYPEDDSKLEEAEALNVEPWMLDLLKLNPSYCFWGPGEDYMATKGEGWNSSILRATWRDFGPWELDEMNEVVNFYFKLGRDSKECEVCAGNGYHPDAQWVSESFYRHSSPFTLPTEDEQLATDFLAKLTGGEPERLHGRANYPSAQLLEKYGPEFRAFCEEMRRYGCWNDRITQDEVDALIEHKRLIDLTDDWVEGEGWKPKDPPAVVTPEMVNARQGGRLDSHDAINRWILIEARLKRLGIPKSCKVCDGKGYVYTADKGHVGLVLWVLHPRKGCSRGVEIKRLEQEDIPGVLAYLREAAARNAERFAKALAA